MIEDYAKTEDAVPAIVGEPTEAELLKIRQAMIDAENQIVAISEYRDGVKALKLNNIAAGAYDRSETARVALQLLRREAMTREPQCDPGVERVREFHEAFNCVISPDPRTWTLNEYGKAVVQSYAEQLLDMAKRLKNFASQANASGDPTLGLMCIRLQLQVEETGELAEAIAQDDLVSILDALTDISYVTDGTYLTFGLGDLKAAAYEEVHSSNMSKLGEDGKPILSVAGRVEKGPNYRKPDFRKLLDI